MIEDRCDARSGMALIGLASGAERDERRDRLHLQGAQRSELDRVGERPLRTNGEKLREGLDGSGTPCDHTQLEGSVCLCIEGT